MKRLNKILSNIKNKTKLFLNTRKKKVLFSLCLVLCLLLPSYFIFFRNSAEASWWDEAWHYRKSIPVNNASGSTLTDFQVKILTNYDLSGDISNGKIQTDLDDLRFTDKNGNLLDYWIEDSTNNSVDIWLKIPSLSTSGATVYMYYGNPQAGVYSDGNKVFDFFDDFNDSNIDPAKWEMLNLGSGGSYVEQNGNLELTASNNLTGSANAKTKKTFTNNVVMEWRRFDTEQQYNNFSFGYGNVTGLNGSTNYYHSVSQYGYSSIIQNNSMFYYRRLDNGISVILQSDINGPDAGQWIKHKNVYSSAGLWNWYSDTGNSYTLLGTGQTDVTYLNNDKYILLSRGGYSGGAYGGTSQIDYVLVRKYASTEPTTGTFGNEEKGPSPSLYLPFDEGFGTTAHDESSNRNDGTIVGATWKDESNCKSGKCLEFDGNGDYVEINDNNSLDLDKDITLEAWVKPQTTNLSNQTIISKEETTTEPTKIFRSVGPGATSAIATGTTNSMTIIGDRAIFQNSLPDNVGVGDAIQYDSDNDNDIDASDKIVFIHERINSKEYIVKTNNGNIPDSVTNDNNWGLFRAYTSLSNAERGVENTGINVNLRNFDDWTAGGDATTDDVGKDLVAANQQWNIACYANGTTADTSQVTIDGWNTGANNFMRVYTPINNEEVGVSQRHNGKWDDGKYNIRRESPIVGRVSNVKIQGLQIYNNSTASYRNAIDFNNPSNYFQNLDISDNIITSNNNAAYNSNGGIVITAYSGSNNINIKNNLIYNLRNSGIYLDTEGSTSSPEYIYNNTIHNVSSCVSGSRGQQLLKNNICQGSNVIGYSSGTGSFSSQSSNNISSDATAPGTNSKTNTTVSFVSTTAGSEDFHLSPTDTAAKDAGADLSGDNAFPFATDVDGQLRLNLKSPQGSALNSSDNKWDIGADEAQATQIYRSVAPGKTDALEVGVKNSLTIVGGIATFAKAMAAEVGVGDVIQYDDDNDGDIDVNDSLAFITGRISNFQFTISNASGGVPTEVINDNDWSIFRAYTSLANAENGDENTGIDSDLRNFDTWTGGKDLVTSKEQWNIACYANGTEADTTAVEVNGWTTNSLYYPKIYTPVNENEVGISQRHNGKWSIDKYHLSVSSGNYGINQVSNGLKIDGIQVKLNPSVSGGGVIYTSNSAFFVSNCYIELNGNTSIGGITALGSSNGTSRIFNNIIKGNNSYAHLYNAGISLLGGTSGLPSYIYNNTIIGFYRGINAGSASNPRVCKNNIAIGQTLSSYEITNATGSDYNLSDDGTSTGGANDKINQTVNFVDQANGDYHLSPTDTIARNAGVDLSNDANLPIRSDIDGERRDAPVGRLYDIGADEAAATKIYRSVGPGNTSALATDENHENEIEVMSGVATFDAALPDNIGVGDAVIIDTGGTANAIDASDTLLFIHGRNSSTSYNLRTHTGSLPGNISSNDTYQIFRAYTSLANAESGTKNTSIPMTFNGGNRDLVANNEEWNIACYADGVDTGAAEIENWTTGKENFLNIYTPVNSSEVGISQRHNGKWDNSKFRIISDNALSIKDKCVKIDGIQARRSANAISYPSAISYTPSLDAVNTFFLSNSIMEMGNVSNEAQVRGVYLNSSGATMYVWNNIITGWKPVNGTTGAYGMQVVNGTAYVYNNVIYDNYNGIRVTANNLVKNNAVFNNVDDFYNLTGLFNNASDDGDGTNPIVPSDWNMVFRDPANKDFRLLPSDTSLRNKGLNLSYDYYLPITNDIEGELRPALGGYAPRRVPTEITDTFDIGADQISNTVHNNYSLSLNKNYSQTNFSTSNNDKDNFSSGDINLEANKWSHIVYKRNNNLEELYINGSKKDSKSISNFLKTNNGKIYIGSKNSKGENSFKGLIDEVRIYPYARTESEVKKDTAQGSAGIAAQRASEGVSVSMGDKAQTLSDGLVGYWKMDENSWNGTAGEVKDTSGNNNHGTAVGGATTGAGKFGNGGNFDGVDDYLDTNKTGAPFDFERTDAFTMSAWINLNNVSGNKVIVSKGSSAPRMVFFIESNKIIVMLTNNEWNSAISVRSSDGSIVANKWQHVSFSYDGSGNASGLKIYIDGRQDSIISLNNLSGTIKNSGKVLIGKSTNASSPWPMDGNIDEVRIYNRALSPDEVKKLYEYAPGPVMHLKMDEKVQGNGKIINDVSGNSNNGTTNDGANDTGMDCTKPGKIGGACEFDGVDDDINLGDFSGVERIGAFSVSAWINPYNKDHPGSMNEMIVDKEGGGADTFYLSWSSTESIVFCVGDGTATNICGSKANFINYQYTWHHVEGVYDGNQVVVYVDGVKGEGVGILSGLTANSPHNLTISGNDSSWWNGKIDDVKIYNYARTQEQILEDMGSPAQGSGALQSPVLDLSFDEGQGNTAYDKSINKNNGTLNSGTTGSNTTTTAMWDKNGKFGGAMEFDGTDDIVDVGVVNIKSWTSLSASLWFKANSLSSFMRMLSIRYSGSDDIRIYRNTDSTLRVEFDDGSVSGVSYPFTDTANWHHVIATYDSKTIKMYLDGKEVGTPAADAFNFSGAIGDTFIGGQDGVQLFNGKIDEVKIYNYALSEDEVRTLYNGGNSMSLGGEMKPANNNGTSVTGDSMEYCVPGDSAKCDKPVLELNMDEMNGTTVNDKSGNGNNGTINGATWEPAGKRGGALKFDGNDYIPFAGFSLPSSGSFSAWVQSDFDESSASNDYILITDGASGTSHYRIRYQGNIHRYLLYVGSASIVLPTETVDFSGWWHIYAVWDASGSKLYKNGKLWGSQSGNGLNSGGVNTIIGAESTNYTTFATLNNWRGKIDDVKIYDYARTPAQIAWDYNQGRPIAHWKMDEGEGTTVHNDSLNNNHGTMTNMDPATDWVEGKNGKALDFDGTNDYVNLDSSVNNIEGLNQGTITGWFKTSATGVMSLLTLSEGSTANQNNMRLLTGNTTGSFDDESLTFALVRGGTSVLMIFVREGANRYADGQWHHFAVATGGGDNKFYIDGQPKSITFVGGSASTQEFSNINNADSLRIGGARLNNSDAYYPFNGQIDDVKIYNYPLTAEQVKQDYNNGAVKFE